MDSTNIFSSFKRENIRAQSQSKAKINLQPPSVWDPTHNLLGSFKGLGHFSSHAPCSTHTSRPLGSRCLYSTAAAALGGHLMVLASSKHCMTPSVLGHQLQMRLHLLQWPSMTSHSAKSQLFFMTASCLQNQYHLGDSYTLPSPATAQGTTLAISGTQPLCSQKTLLRRCHLNDAGLFLITANFLAPANQHQ